jgi:hypothetical protein
MFLLFANLELAFPGGSNASPIKYNFLHPLSIAKVEIVYETRWAPSMITRVKAKFFIISAQAPIGLQHITDRFDKFF